MGTDKSNFLILNNSICCINFYNAKSMIVNDSHILLRYLASIYGTEKDKVGSHSLFSTFWGLRLVLGFGIFG